MLNNHGLPWHPAALYNAASICDAYVDPCALVLHRRIGSPSANGEVYDVTWTFNGHGALKVMMPDDTSENEVRIATFLSESVTSRVPIVYADATCNFCLSTSTPFGRDVKDRHVREKLKDLKISTADSRDARRLNRAWLSMSIAELCDGLDPHQIELVMSATHFKTRVMVSEIAYSDIRYLLSRGIAEDAFATIIMECLDCLLDLFRLGVSHGDVHFGNFLIRRQSNDDFQVIIHDFGMSELDCVDHERYMFDIEKLLDCVIMTGHFVDVVQSCLPIVRKVSSLAAVERCIVDIKAQFQPFSATHLCF